MHSYFHHPYIFLKIRLLENFHVECIRKWAELLWSINFSTFTKNLTLSGSMRDERDQDKFSRVGGRKRGTVPSRPVPCPSLTTALNIFQSFLMNCRSLGLRKRAVIVNGFRFDQSWIMTDKVIGQVIVGAEKCRPF